jgi:hypothetical protein
MAHPTPVGISKNTSLADLNVFVGQQEDSLGPLTAIGNDGNQTVLTFDTDPASPAIHAVIAADNGAAPVIPANSTQVCRGKVFIAGTLTASTATRAKG